jgi:carbon monoxide dehydrogenase subunit G
MQLNGQEEFDRPPAELWPSLSNPRFLCECFPGVDHVVRADDRSAALVVRPGFSFVRGTLEVTFEFLETNPTTSARVDVQLKGIGSSGRFEARFELARTAAGSIVRWSVTIAQLGGLLKAVSQGLLQAAAAKVAADTWTEVRRRLAGRVERERTTDAENPS